MVEKISQDVLGKQTSDGIIMSGSVTRVPSSELLLLEDEKPTIQDNETMTRSMEHQLGKVTWTSQPTGKLILVTFRCVINVI